MSARRIQPIGQLNQPVTVEQRQTRLSLTAGSVVFHKNGIEFRSPTPFTSWTEMTLNLQSPEGRFHCAGVVISCTGSKHAGYHVSMIFTNLSKQAQAQLSTLVFSQLG